MHIMAACTIYNAVPGGAIVDIIRDTSEVVTIRGYVPAADPFVNSTTTVQLSSKACGLHPECTATTTALNTPRCNLYSVDMTFSSADGLVTDKLRASSNMQPHAPKPPCCCMSHAISH